MFEPLENYHPEILWLDEKYVQRADVRVGVVRLDKIHPIASGNKLFKLHFFLKDALQKSTRSVTSIGGAYSNHLLALAACCMQLDLQCRGIVRGERPATLSLTLQDCERLGMNLQFVSRDEYFRLTSREQILENDTYWVPEGGFHPLGAKGASLINGCIAMYEPTHICCAVGTATTIAGILRNPGAAKVIAVPVLRNLTDIFDRVQFLNEQFAYDSPIVLDDCHFGGYAKHSATLFDFMNDLYLNSGLPTDFVYTGKMMFAIISKIREGFFAPGSTILCLHTGGLQGNHSLKAGSLVF